MKVTTHTPPRHPNPRTPASHGRIPSPARRERARVRATGADKRAGTRQTTTNPTRKPPPPSFPRNQEPKGGAGWSGFPRSRGNVRRTKGASDRGRSVTGPTPFVEDVRGRDAKASGGCSPRRANPNNHHLKRKPPLSQPVQNRKCEPHTPPRHPNPRTPQPRPSPAMDESPLPARRERVRVRVTGADKRAGHGKQPPAQFPTTQTPSSRIRTPFPETHTSYIYTKSPSIN